MRNVGLDIEWSEEAIVEKMLQIAGRTFNDIKKQEIVLMKDQYPLLCKSKEYLQDIATMSWCFQMF